MNKTKYAVITYDSDEQKTFVDHIEAGSQEQATNIAFKVRDYQADCAWHVATYSLDELKAIAAALENNPNPARHVGDMCKLAGIEDPEEVLACINNDPLGLEEEGELLFELYQVKAKNPDGEYTAYPRSDWQYEVQNGDTKLGYWEWAEHQIEASSGDVGQD